MAAKMDEDLPLKELFQKVSTLHEKIENSDELSNSEILQVLEHDKQLVNTKNVSKYHVFEDLLSKNSMLFVEKYYRCVGFISKNYRKCQ